MRLILLTIFILTMPAYCFPEGYHKLYHDSSNNVGIGTTNPLYKLHVENAIYTSSDVVFSDSSSQGTAHNPIAISSEPAHNPDVASLTYVGVATVTYTNTYARFTQCGYVLSVNNGSGAARTYTAVIVVDGVMDADHEHPQKNSGAGDSLHIDTHYVVMSAGEHNCSVWVKTSNITGGAQVADNAHVDVIRH